ncbi:MAG: cytidine deaminase [Lachnospiraceae bacterium]|nr:cytidine deaminase [Lachnospiraceae bacterium]
MTLEQSVIFDLIEKANDARKHAYTPYSEFKVGAALLLKNGEIVTGCNIENSAFSPTNCAERTAFFKAISEGERDFVAIAVVGGKKEIPESFAFPCGVCRQVMREFCEDDFQIIVAKTKQEYKIFTLPQLLPEGFGGGNIV